MTYTKQDFTKSFRECQLHFSRLHAWLLAKEGLSLQQFVMLSVLNNHTSMTMSSASEHLQITKPAVTNIVDRLEKRKMIKRAPHPKDRRITLLQIQPKGKKTIAHVQEQVFGLLFKTLSSFKDKDKQQIFRFYQEVCVTMRGHWVKVAEKGKK